MRGFHATMRVKPQARKSRATARLDRAATLADDARLMTLGKKPSAIKHRPRGNALEATLGLLAIVALSQVSLFVNLQGRPTGADKAGTTDEIETSAAVVTTPDLSPAMAILPAELASEDDPAILPEIMLAPREKIAAISKPPPPRPEASDPIGTDPAILPREDLKMLVAEAIRLRRNGDMAGAVGKLNAALDSLPGHPRLVFEMASTYEAMGMTERAMESYRNVAAMGPRAGVLQSIAERRLKDVTETVAGTGSGGADDTLFLAGNEEVREPSVDGETILLRFDIQARPGTVIEAEKVSLPVKFFDLVGGKQAEPSMAETPQVRWTTPPVDWKEPGIETVEVRYHLPSDLRDDGPGERKYLGYVVELRYRDKLLDVVSRPRRLVLESPPPQLPSSPPNHELPPGLPEELPVSLGGPLLGP